MKDLEFPLPAWEFDHLDNAVDYLEMVNYFLEQLQTPWKWKWVAISLHQALYSFMISALAGTDPMHSVIERNVAENPKSNRAQVGAAHALESEGKTIQEIAVELKITPQKVKTLLGKTSYLISFDEALKRIQRHDELPKVNIIPLQLSEDEKDTIRRLKDDIRNDFEHFSPKTWITYDLQYFAQVVKPVVRVIYFVALESNYIDYLQDDERPGKINQAVKRIIQSLS